MFGQSIADDNEEETYCMHCFCLETRVSLGLLVLSYLLIVVQASRYGCPPLPVVCPHTSFTRHEYRHLQVGHLQAN
jgi:hypothetical protein